METTGIQSIDGLETFIIMIFNLFVNKDSCFEHLSNVSKDNS